ncbi:MAG: DUF1003 domain-containing protein [Acidobacteria bacterium]|nr:DUF1003 domain-containing protein [Acidobacteriota bacterium]
MLKRGPETACCDVCKQTMKISQLIPALTIREAIIDEIVKKCPGWSASSYICHEDLDTFRAEYVRNCLTEEKGELTQMEAEVVKSIEDEEVLARNINSQFDSKLTFGQRVADRVAEFGGSWIFIGIFGAIIVVWMAINSCALMRKPMFDPFPFILLNLVLSCVAAVQAPVIMMSQNRAEAKDRMRAEHDYQVNLKAELEIRNLHEKIDHLLHQQWQRLLEIQQIQTDLMAELAQGKARGD